MPTDNDDESWRMRQEVWDDPRVMLGGSDAGAHLDRMCGSTYTTRLLADCLRGRKLATLERAVQMLTQAPAELFGLVDRGTIAVGNHADLVVFDPETVGAENARLVEDLPGGTARLTAGSRGRRAGVRRRRGHGRGRQGHRRHPGPGPPLGPDTVTVPADPTAPRRSGYRRASECRSGPMTTRRGDSDRCRMTADAARPTVAARSTPATCSPRPARCWTTSWRCAATCTGGPSSASTCRTPRPGCWRRSTACR